MPTIINTNTTISQVNIATQKATEEAEYQALLNGINSELGDVPTFVIAKRAYTKAELVARFQARIDAARKTKTDRTTLHASVAAERTMRADAAKLRAGFKQYLQSRYGKDSAELQKFGFTQAKTPQRSVVGKAKGLVQNKATRVARGTKGKKQKSTIKGTPPATATTASTPAAQVAVDAKVAAVAAPPAAKPATSNPGTTS
jgi:hypothetical protein